MNKIEQCKKCKKRKFDFKQGLICGLTNEKSGFEVICPDFENDDSIKETKGLELRPNEQRAKILLSLIWIVLILEIISLISSGLQYSLLQTLSNGGVITNEAVTANDLREQSIGILYLIAYISSGIVFIMWFRRAYFNLHQKVKSLSYTEGWAAGSWFVPIVNLYRPYEIMKELYEETKKCIIDEDKSLYIDLTTNLLGIWWTLWIINGILGNIVFRLSRQADTIPELLTVTIISLISGFIGVGLGIVTIRVIKDYSKVERLLTMKE